MRKTMSMLAGAAVVAGLAGGAMAQDKKILGGVVKGIDNPFVTGRGQGSAVGRGAKVWGATPADGRWRFSIAISSGSPARKPER